jgi:hypothetical protein
VSTAEALATAEAATSSAPAPAPRLAPYAILRVATLAYDRLRALAPAAHARCIDAQLTAARRLAVLRGPLEDDLHAAVPLAGERATRRLLLAVRRAVHADRPLPLEDAARACVHAVLPAEAALRLDSWREVVAERDQVRAGADALLGAEVRGHLRPGLRALLEDPELADALALASPDLHEQLRRDIEHPPTGTSSSKSERSLLAYALRAGTKTNPFSTFMHAAVVGLDVSAGSSAPSVTGLARRRRVAIDRGVVERLQRCLVAYAPERVAGRLRRNASWRALGAGRVEVVGAEHLLVQGRFWRLVRASVFRLPQKLAALLAAEPGEWSAAELTDGLRAQGASARDARVLLAGLLAGGLVAAEPTIDGLDAAPAAMLAGQLGRAHDHEAARAVRAALLALLELAAQVEAAPAPARPALVERMRAHELAALTATGVEAAPSPRNLVLESASFIGTPGSIGAPLARLLEQAALAIRPRLGEDPTYALLRERFVRAHGAGGRVRDACAYLVEEHRQLAATSATPRALSDAPLAPVLPGSAPVTLAVQIAAASQADAAAGRARVVINRIHAGIGGLTARYAQGEDPTLHASMRAWLARALAPFEPVDLLLSAECNELQAHPQLTERVLVSPTEPVRRDRPGVLALADVALAHDRASDRLVLLDHHEVALLPVHLGASMVLPALGLAYLLALLATPHALRHPHEVAPRDPGVTFEYRPREIVGDVVLRRAEWWIRARTLQGWLDATGSARLLALAVALDRHGVPRRFFARPFLARAEALAALMRAEPSAYKPLWVDADNPFCLDLLTRQVEGREWIVLSEVLPDGDELWLAPAGAGCASELLVEAVV